MIRGFSRMPAIGAVAALLLPLPVGAATFHVPAERSTIQAGIDAASEGDTVLVAPNTYAGPGNRDIDFGGVNITLLSEGGAAATVIDCEGAGRAFYFHTSEDTTSRIEGFAVRNGSADYGGAVRCQGASPWFYDCTFSWCQASMGGGAIHANSTSAPRIEVCILNDNSARSGGAVYMDGSAGSFGNCQISGNNASMFGGAVYLSGIAETSFDFVDFTGNTAPVYGGAVYSVNAEPAFTWCTFVANEANYGGGVYAQSDYNPPEFTRCTFADNEGGGICSKDAYPVVTRSILAFDRTRAGILCTGLGEPSVTHSFVYGNAGGDTLCGTHSENVFEDPRLCAVFAGDVGLCDDSPCIASLNPWGEHVGAMLAGCPDCGSAVEATSWGLLKGMFRE